MRQSVPNFVKNCRRYFKKQLFRQCIKYARMAVEVLKRIKFWFSVLFYSC